MIVREQILDGFNARVSVAASVSQAQLDEVIALVGQSRQRVAKAVNAALADTAESARREIIAAVSADLGVSQAELRRRNIFLGTPRAVNNEMRIQITGRRIPLMHFSPRRTAGGVRITLRGAGRQDILHAFLATMKSGHQGVMIRKSAQAATDSARRQFEKSRHEWLLRHRFHKWDPNARHQGGVFDPWGRPGSHRGAYAMDPLMGQEYSPRFGGKPATALARLTRITGRTYGAGAMVGRLPITELRGPSVPQVFDNLPEMAESVLDKHIADELHDRLIAEATKIAADGGSDDA